MIKIKKKITGTVVPVHDKKAYGRQEVHHHIFLTLALLEASYQLHTLVTLHPGKQPPEPIRQPDGPRWFGWSGRKQNILPLLWS